MLFQFPSVSLVRCLILLTTPLLSHHHLSFLPVSQAPSTTTPSPKPPQIWPLHFLVPSSSVVHCSVTKLCSDSAILLMAACQASLSFTISWGLLRLMSIELIMPSNHLTLCHPLLLLPSIFPSIRVFFNESALYIRWQSTGASASASVLPMNIQD